MNFHRSRLRIEARVEGVEVSGVQLLLKTAKSLLRNAGSGRSRASLRNGSGSQTSGSVPTECYLSWCSGLSVLGRPCKLQHIQKYRGKNTSSPQNSTFSNFTTLLNLNPFRKDVIPRKITTAGAFPSSFQTGTRNQPSNTTFRKDRYIYMELKFVIPNMERHSATWSLPEKTKQNKEESTDAWRYSPAASTCIRTYRGRMILWLSSCRSRREAF